MSKSNGTTATLEQTTCPSWCTEHHLEYMANGEVDFNYHQGSVTVGNTSIGVAAAVPWDGNPESLWTDLYIKEDQDVSWEDLDPSALRELAFALLEVADLMAQHSARASA